MPWTEHLMRFATATLVFALAAWAMLLLSRASGGIATIWIANALILGFAMRRPPKAIGALLAAVILGTALASVLTERSFVFGLLAGTFNALEVGLVYAAFHRFGFRSTADFNDRSLLLFLLVSVVLAPAISASMGASLTSLQSDASWAELFGSWWLADAFGMFVVLPVMWSYERRDARELLTGARSIEFWALMGGSILISALALTHLSRPYVVLSLPLLLAAVRTGVFGIALCNLGMIATALTIVGLQQRRILPTPEEARLGLQVSEVWLFACMSAMGPLLVAMLTAQRDRERRQAVTVGERLQVIADTLPAYVAELGPDLRYRFANAKYQDWLGRAPGSVVGRVPSEVLGDAAAVRLWPHMQAALAGERQHFQFHMPNGQQLEVHYEPLAQSGGFVLMAQDITAQVEAEQRFRHLLESAPDAMVVLDAQTREILRVNRQVELTFGHPRDELLGKSIGVLIERADMLDSAAITAHLDARSTEQGADVVQVVGIRSDGSRFPVEAVLSRLDEEEGPLLVAALRDVSARLRAERALHDEKERAQVTLESIGDAVITYDTALRITSMNPVAEAMTGWSRTDALGRPFTEVVHLQDAESGSQLNPVLAGEEREELEASALLRRRDGQLLHVEDSDAPIRDSEGAITGGVIVLHDVSEARAMAQRMSHLAQHDFLTGLPNRVLLQDRLAQALAKVGPDTQGAVLFVDLDFFKHINDSLGHHAGDRVLQEVARRLCEVVRTDDTVSRPGGDEFMLLLARLSEPHDAARVARKLIKAIERPIDVDGRALHVSASVGIALFPEDGRDIKALTKHADTALYHAKQAGRGRYSFFTAAMSERADQRLKLESELRAGIAGGQLFLAYQPKVTMPGGGMSGMEALVRWRHPDGHTVPPLDFIPVAEETGLVVAIDEWVMREACRQNRAWLDAGLAAVPIAVNVSLARFEPERLLDNLRRALDETGLPPHLLEVEFTESQMLGQHARAGQLIDGIRGLGVRLSVDDFGTGYSSLSYLTSYRFDSIKIDRSFVQGLPGELGQRAVVQAIMGMAQALGYRVVGEGVETDQQAAALMQYGCSEMQGYLFGRPVGADEMETMLRTQVVRPRAALGLQS